VSPRDADAHYARAINLLTLGRTDQAVAAAREALNANPDHADAREFLAKVAR
jgi:hypothetical protein